MIFFFKPCSFQASVVGRQPFSILRGEALQIATRREGDGKRESWIKKGGERRREWGSVAAAVRLNDVFQEEQSSLSNRRLRNELAYLLDSARRCATAFHIPR